MGEGTGIWKAVFCSSPMDFPLGSNGIKSRMAWHETPAPCRQMSRPDSWFASQLILPGQK